MYLVDVQHIVANLSVISVSYGYNNRKKPTTVTFFNVRNTGTGVKFGLTYEFFGHAGNLSPTTITLNCEFEEPNKWYVGGRGIDFEMPEAGQSPNEQVFTQVVKHIENIYLEQAQAKLSEAPALSLDGEWNVFGYSI
jgi:hypothetical protein